MIRWDDLKHIHVIRKLNQVLGQWFHTELFFFDEKGTLQGREFSPKGEYANPLVAAFAAKETSRNGFLSWVQAQLDDLSRGAENRREILGPLGVEHVVCSRIVIEGEFLGVVMAVCRVDANWEKAWKFACEQPGSPVLKRLHAWGLEAESMPGVFARLPHLSDQDRKYFEELVELVAQEVVTYHTEITKREDRISALNTELGQRYSYDQMIGKSQPMQTLYGMLDKIRSSESSVLVQGENGTGKELIARSIHYNSSRKERPFVTVNCSAFNENLLDSELFGHVKGSFTGAIKDKKGLFESAHQGTLFLDEIGDMSLTMQVKLLRVLQEGTFMMVGGTDLRKVDVRVISATNKNLKAMVENGTFREDLYYRINVINLHVPALRERKDDIPVLLEHFVAKGCEERKCPVKQFGTRALEKILDYPWPGNIRELQNEVERLIVLSGDEPRIDVELISPRIRDHGGAAQAKGVRLHGRLKDALEELEKTMILEGLRRTKWNKSRLAKELGISRAGLIMKVEKYGLDKRKLMRDEAA